MKIKKMIEEKTVYSIVCDICGTEFQFYDEEKIFNSLDELQLKFFEADTGWTEFPLRGYREVKKGDPVLHFCPDCHVWQWGEDTDPPEEIDILKLDLKRFPDYTR